MAPFSVPAPHIVPLHISPFGAQKSIDTNTKIELFCDTYINHEIFYTLGGTKPQPYAGIVQGNKTIKYVSPFCLPAGKITVRAIAIHAKLHSMYSNVITKTFKVEKAEKRCPLLKMIKMKKKKEKTLECVDLNKPSTSNGVEEVSEHISDDMTHNSLKSLSNGILHPPKLVENNVELSDEDELLKDNHDSSLDCSSIGESLDEDKTYYDADEAHILKEHESPEIKTSTFNLESEGILPNFQMDVNGLNEMTDLIQFGTSDLNPSCYSCKKCEKDSEICFVCQEKNSLVAKYCIQCGQRLKKICQLCKEVNPIISKFCQYCGHKLLGDNSEASEIISSGIDKILPSQKENVAIQCSMPVKDKCIQCSPIKLKSSASPVPKKLPPHSPGRGYWRQQLDFICNHLKSHAYNDNDFRKSISQPVLSTFQSAEVIENEENITVTLTFLSLNTETQKSFVV